MEIFLSRVYLNTLNRDVRMRLADCYRMHQEIMAVFPDVKGGTAAREMFGVLYRIETLENDPGAVRMLVQSSVLPDWTRFPQAWLQTSEDGTNPSVRPLTTVYARVHTGMNLHFRLRANPTKRLGRSAQDRDDHLVGKRVALLHEEDQLSWLERKGEQHGFRILRAGLENDVPSAQAAKQAVSRGWRHDSTRTPKRLSFGAVLFNGLLEVADDTAFRAALIDGVGSGKAFGFGLLSIAQPR